MQLLGGELKIEIGIFLGKSLNFVKIFFCVFLLISINDRFENLRQILPNIIPTGIL